MSNYGSASISQANYDFAGQFDETGLRCNYGCQKWDHLQHKYAGYFLYNNLHGNGFYFVQKEHYNTFYDGQFYNNELEGYGQVIHKDGTIFEGLFKKNRRFGPGILTYPDGKQDVGLWNGLSLIRLSIKLCGDTVPRLGKSVLGKTKLLRFKKIVPACDNFKEPAKDILCNMAAPPEIIDSYMRLYNPQVRNKNSLFFDRRHYNLSHFGSEDCFIDVIKESDAKIVIENETTGETDDVCFCSNERCVQLGDQIAGLQLKMASLDETIKHYETQLNTCGLCRVPKNSSDNQDESEAIHHEEISCLCDRRMNEIEDVIESELEKIKLDRLFYQTAIDFLNHKYHQEISSINDFNGKPETTKVMVKHLLAWNNEDLAIQILQHCFRYRNFEDNINFNIKTLLTGDREKFGKPGSYERNCFMFLNHCKDGNCLEASRTLLKYTLNPDLCDGRGNTGMHLAASKNHRDIIQLLTNCGANLNITNDECLSPLLICLVLYLACLHHVVDWEKAFLCDVTLDEKERAEVTQWRPHESLLNLKVNRYFASSDSSIHSLSSRNSTNISDDMPSNIQLNLDGNTNDYFLLSMRYLKRGDAKIHKTLTGKTAKPFVDRIEDKGNTILADTEKLDEISKTVDALLYYGANPNVGATPLPPVLLAIFTKNPKIVEDLLEHNGNPNTMLEENLSPLHILVSLEPCGEYVEICEIFLKHSSDPNIKTEINHWADQNNSLIGAYGNRSTPGRKTPLQMLCMREDFRGEDQAYFSEMARALLQHEAIHDNFFLGHTPLSLAVLRGNVDLVKTLCDYVDYDKALGENMGNALTVLALTRYPYAIPFHECKAVIDQLLESSMNPFNSIYDFPNVFEFLRSEAPPIKNSNKPKVQAKIETGLSRLRKIVNSNKIKIITKKCNLLSKEYLMQRGRNILMIRHKFQAILYFYTFVDLNFLKDVCVKNLAKFFTMDDALVYLKMLVQSELIPSNFFSRELAITLLKFVQKINKTKKGGAKKKKTKASKGKLSSKRSQTTSTIEKLVNNLDFNTESSTKLFENIFDDHNDGYEVCCYCLGKTDRVILHCPGCGIVSYCSARCNKYGNKLNKLYHKCKGLFYNKMKRLHDQSISSGTPFPNRIELVLHKAAQIWSEQQVSSSETKYRQSGSLMYDSINVPDKRTALKIGYSKGLERKGATVKSFVEDTTHTDSLKFRSTSERNKVGSKRSMEESYGAGKEEQNEESKHTKSRSEAIRTLKEPEQNLEGPRKSIRGYGASSIESNNTRSRSEALRTAREPEQNLQGPRKRIREYGASLIESVNTKLRSEALRTVREPEQNLEGPRKRIKEYGASLIESKNTRSRREASKTVREPEQNLEEPRKSMREYGASFIESGMNNVKKRLKAPGVRIKRQLSFLTNSQTELVKRKYQRSADIANEIRTFIIEDDMTISGGSAKDEKIDEVSINPVNRLGEKIKYSEIYEMKGNAKVGGGLDKDTKIGTTDMDAPKNQPEMDLQTIITKDGTSLGESDKYSDIHKITDSVVDAIRTGIIKDVKVFGDDTKQFSMTTRTGMMKNGRRVDTSAKYHGIDSSMEDRTGPQELTKPGEIQQVDDSSMKNTLMDNIAVGTLNIARAINTENATEDGTNFERIKNEGKDFQKIAEPDESNHTRGTMKDGTNLTANAKHAESVSSPAYETQLDIMKDRTVPQGIEKSIGLNKAKGVIKDETTFGRRPADELRSGIRNEGKDQKLAEPDEVKQTSGTIKDGTNLTTNAKYAESVSSPAYETRLDIMRDGTVPQGLGKSNGLNETRGVMKDGTSFGRKPADELRSGIKNEEKDQKLAEPDEVKHTSGTIKDGTNLTANAKYAESVSGPAYGTRLDIVKDRTVPQGIGKSIGLNKTRGVVKDGTSFGRGPADGLLSGIENVEKDTKLAEPDEAKQTSGTMEDGTNLTANAKYAESVSSPAYETRLDTMKDRTVPQGIGKSIGLNKTRGVIKDGTSFGRGPVDGLRSGIENVEKGTKLAEPDEAKQTSGTMEDGTNLTANAKYAESVSSPAYETRLDTMKDRTVPQGIGKSIGLNKTRGVVKDGTSFGRGPVDGLRSGIENVEKGTKLAEPDEAKQTSGTIKDGTNLTANAKYAESVSSPAYETRLDTMKDRTVPQGIGKSIGLNKTRGVIKDGTSFGRGPVDGLRSGIENVEKGTKLAEPDEAKQTSGTMEDGTNLTANAKYAESVRSPAYETRSDLMKDRTVPQGIGKSVGLNKTRGVIKDGTSFGRGPADGLRSGIENVEKGKKLAEPDEAKQTSGTMKDGTNLTTNAKYPESVSSSAYGTRLDLTEDVTTLQGIEKSIGLNETIGVIIDGTRYTTDDQYTGKGGIESSLTDETRSGLVKEGTGPRRISKPGGINHRTGDFGKGIQTGIIKDGKILTTNVKYGGKHEIGESSTDKPDERSQATDIRNDKMYRTADIRTGVMKNETSLETNRGYSGKDGVGGSPTGYGIRSGVIEEEVGLQNTVRDGEMNQTGVDSVHTQNAILKDGTDPEAIPKFVEKNSPVKGTKTGVKEEGTSLETKTKTVFKSGIGGESANEIQSGVGLQDILKHNIMNQTGATAVEDTINNTMKDRNVATHANYVAINGRDPEAIPEFVQTNSPVKGTKTGVKKEETSIETKTETGLKSKMGVESASGIQSGVTKQGTGLQGIPKHDIMNKTGATAVEDTMNNTMKDRNGATHANYVAINGRDPEAIPEFVQTNSPVKGTKTGVKKEETSIETKTETGLKSKMGVESASGIQSGVTKQGTGLQGIPKHDIMNKTGATAVEDTMNNTMKDRNGATHANYVAINGIGGSPTDETQYGTTKDTTALQIIDKKGALIQKGGGLVKDPRSFIIKDRTSFGKGTKIEGTYKITNVPLGLPQTVILKVETSLGKSTLKIDIDDLVKNGQTDTVYGTILSKNGKREAISGTIGGTGLIPESDNGSSNHELVKSSLWGYSTGKLDILGGEIHATEEKDAKKIDQGGIASRISDTEVATETGKGKEVMSTKEEAKQIVNKGGGGGGTKIGIEKVKTLSDTRMVLNKLKTSYEGKSKSSGIRSTINLDMQSKSRIGDTLRIDQRGKRSNLRVARDEDVKILVDSRSKIKSTLSLHPDTKPESSQVSYEKIQTSLWDYAKGKMQESAENIYLTVEKPRKPKHAEDELDAASSRKRRTRVTNTSAAGRFFDSKGNLIDYETWKRVGGKIYDSEGILIDPEAWYESRKKFYDSKGNLINPEERNNKGGIVYDYKGNIVGPEIWSMKGRTFFDSRGNLINPDEWSEKGGKVYDSRGNLVGPEAWSMKGRNFFDSKGNLVDREEWSKRGRRIYDSKGNLIPRSGKSAKFGGRRGRIRSGRRTRGKSRSASRKSGSGRGSSRRGDASGKEGGANLGRYNSMPLGSFRGDTREGAARLSKLYRYFLELLVKYFPEFELGCLLFPFAVFNEGQLYYKFSEVSHIYGRTYSVV